MNREMNGGKKKKKRNNPNEKKKQQKNKKTVNAKDKTGKRSTIIMNEGEKTIKKLVKLAGQNNEYVLKKERNKETNSNQRTKEKVSNIKINVRNIKLSEKWKPKNNSNEMNKLINNS